MSVNTTGRGVPDGPRGWLNRSERVNQEIMDAKPCTTEEAMADDPTIGAPAYMKPGRLSDGTPEEP